MGGPCAPIRWPELEHSGRFYYPHFDGVCCSRSGRCAFLPVPFSTRRAFLFVWCAFVGATRRQGPALKPEAIPELDAILLSHAHRRYTPGFDVAVKKGAHRSHCLISCECAVTRADKCPKRACETQNWAIDSPWSVPDPTNAWCGVP